MSFLDELEGLEAEQRSSIEVLTKLLQSKEIEMKSHVVAPLEISILYSLAELLRMDEMKGSSRLLKNFIRYYLKVMVSWKRMSREEIIRAISAIEKEEPSGIVKALTKPG